MTPAQAPTVESINCFQSDSCGGRRWEVQFTLPKPAAASGWIVQKVVHTFHASNPDSSDAGVDQTTYWEAFYVAQGQTATGIYGAFDDKFISQMHPANTKGTESFQGTAEFYEGTLPSSFTRNVAQAGCLRATYDKPDFWTGDGTPHTLTMDWDCTNGNTDAGVQSVPTGGCQ